ncbi:MAG: hypothetical protein M1827_007071 [Pycnora praestabilis]|nr:MAG: hypothetical protein M1827_007071 [Pycnora praestabilis]
MWIHLPRQAETVLPNSSTGVTGASSGAVTATGSSPQAATTSPTSTQAPTISESPTTSAVATTSSPSTIPQSSTTSLSPSTSTAQAPSSSAQARSTQAAGTSQSSSSSSAQGASAVTSASSTGSTTLQPTVITDVVVVTTTSNGAIITPTVITSQTTTPVVAIASQTSSASASSSSAAASSGGSSSTGPIVGGVVGGVGALIIVALIWFCCRRWRRNKVQAIENPSKQVLDSDPREQGIDANRGGDNLEEGGFYRGQRTSTVPKTGSAAVGGPLGLYEKKGPLRPLNREPIADDPVPLLDSSLKQPENEMAGSSPDPSSHMAELPAAFGAKQQPAELLPTPERSNTGPNAQPTYGIPDNVVEADSGTPRSHGLVGVSSVKTIGVGQHKARTAPHVMSYMDYRGSSANQRHEAPATSPSVYSVAESDTSSPDVRSSGVSSPDSPANRDHGRGGRASGGGLETIEDDRRDG